MSVDAWESPRRVPSSCTSAAAGTSRMTCSAQVREHQGDIEGIAMVWRIKAVPRAVYQWNHDGEFDRNVVACIDTTEKSHGPRASTHRATLSQSSVGSTFTLSQRRGITASFRGLAGSPTDRGTLGGSRT